MPTQVPLRVFYIQLIICGFLACVLVARNLCLSDTGTPISCAVSAGHGHGNATGKGASDGQTSEAKVKVQIEGEVMNMGDRRRDVRMEKEFRPLFLMSKGRSRPELQKPSRLLQAAVDRKSRRQVEKYAPGSSVAEPQWSEADLVDGTVIEVVQSRDLLPGGQGDYEFQDMFELSDGLSDQRRRRAGVGRRTEGSEERDVDSKADWYASKVEKDDDEADMKRLHPGSKGMRVNSKKEAFRSISSKVNPAVRIEATIVTKGILPKTKLFDSKSESVPRNADDLTSTDEAAAATSKEKPGIDLKASPPFVVQSDFQWLFGPFASINNLNRTGALRSSHLSKETDQPDSKDLSSSERPSSNPRKVRSRLLGFTDDNESGFLGKILNAIFRGEDSAETSEELTSIDEEDRLEAAKRDAEERLAATSNPPSDDARDARGDAKKKTQIEHSTKGNENVEDHFEDGETSSEMEENRFGSASDSSTVVEHISVDPVESSTTMIVSPLGGVGTSEKENPWVGLILQQKNVLDDIFGRKESSPSNLNDTSNRQRNDSNRGVANKDAIFSIGLGKETHEKAENTPLKAKDNINVETKDLQLEPADVLVKAKKTTDTTPIVLPLNGSIISAQNKYSLLKTRVVYNTKTEATETKADYVAVQATESPNTVQSATENIRNMARVVHEKLNGVLDRAESIQAGEVDIPANANEKSSTAEGIGLPMKRKDLPNKGNDVPNKANGVPVERKDLSSEGNDIPALAKGIPTKQKDLSSKGSDESVKANGIPMAQSYLSEEGNNVMPSNVKDIPTKQHEDLPKRTRDMPFIKTEVSPEKQFESSKEAIDMPSKARVMPTKQEDLPDTGKAIPAMAEDIRMKKESSRTLNDASARTEDLEMKLEDSDESRTADDIPVEAENPFSTDRPGPKDMEVAPWRQPASDHIGANDARGSSSLDGDGMKRAMFIEMKNIMSDLEYLGHLWERLKPGMQLKNSKAVRKVLHAVADVFGLNSKDAPESVSSTLEKSEEEESGKTAAVKKLRYDVAEQEQARDGTEAASREFKDVSSQDLPRGQQKRVGLRSRRSLEGGTTNRRRRVQSTSNRRRRAKRYRDSSEGRKRKRLADPYKERGGQNEDEDEDEEEEALTVVEEEVGKKRRTEKRRGYEDYIFGNNPGYILSRRKRAALLENPAAPAAPAQVAQSPAPALAQSPAPALAQSPAPALAQSPAPTGAEDKAEEDAISRELANLLIEKVYNRVLKSLKAPTLEMLQTSEEANDVEEEETESAGRKHKSRKDLRRAKRGSNVVDVRSYCNTLKTQPFNFTDSDGKVTDLYTEAVNTGVCLDFEMSFVASRDKERRDSPILAEDEEVDKDEREAGTAEVVERETGVEVQGKTRRQAAEEVAGGVVKNEAERAILRDAKTETERETRRLVGEDVTREIDNDVEKSVDRQVRAKARGQTQEEEEEEEEEEAQNEVRRETEEAEEEEAEAEHEVGDEVKADATEEEEESEERGRDVRRETRDESSDGAYSAANDIIRFGGDNWNLEEEDLESEERRRSAGEEEQAAAKQEAKSRRRSRARDRNERGDVEDIVSYIDELKSGEAGEKSFEGQ